MTCEEIQRSMLEMSRTRAGRAVLMRHFETGCLPCRCAIPDGLCVFGRAWEDSLDPEYAEVVGIVGRSPDPPIREGKS